MNIFLTGGTGFIGSYVVKNLSDAGHNITILARNPDKVPALSGLKGVTILPGLLSDFDVIEGALKKKDALIHIALGWGELATSMLKNDTFPSIFLFETAGRFGVSQIIYTSSTAAAGNIPHNLWAVKSAIPNDYYGATKAASESFLYATSEKYSVQCNIIRPGYTFGNPVIDGASIQPDKRFLEIVQKAKQGATIDIFKNDGTQFIWAGDLARVYKAIIESKFNKKCFYCLGTDYFTWERIALKAIELLKSESRIRIKNKKASGAPGLFDVSEIKKAFDFEFHSWDKIVEHLGYLIDVL